MYSDSLSTVAWTLFSRCSKLASQIFQTFRLEQEIGMGKTYSYPFLQFLPVCLHFLPLIWVQVDAPEQVCLQLHG